MAHQLVECVFKLKGYLSALPKGDQIFGLVFKHLSEQLSEAEFSKLRLSFIGQSPAFSFSDMMPTGFFPVPTLPHQMMPKGKDQEISRLKAFKKKKWVPRQQYGESTPDLHVWMDSPLGSLEIGHNTLSRSTFTTGAFGDSEKCDPYSESVFYNKDDKKNNWSVFIWMDSQLDKEILLDTLKRALEAGIGKRASIGRGQFEFQGMIPVVPEKSNSHWYVSLAPVAPYQCGDQLIENRAFYRAFTKFGRHGGAEGVINSPFKFPLLLAESGAIWHLKDGKAGVFGACLGGEKSPVSAAYPQTIHQGFSPIVPLNWELNSYDGI